MLYEPLSSQEERLVQWSVIPTMTYYENVHFQYQPGMLSEEHWQSFLTDFRILARLRPFRRYWAEFGNGTYRSTFEEAVDRFIEGEVPAEIE